MASLSLKFTLLTLSFLVVSASLDPPISDDFLIPPKVNPSTITGDLFTFTGLRGILHSAITKLRVTAVTKKEFPALDGQGVSLSLLQFPPGSVLPLHFHPRSPEAVFVLNGSLELGYVGALQNKVSVDELHPGGLYVVEKSLVHYLYNTDKTSPATAIAAYPTANPGTAFLPANLLGTGIDDAVLSKSFRTDAATIDKIKAAFKSKV